MSAKISGARPVNLYHDYRSIPFSVADACSSCFPIFNADEFRCTNPTYTLIEAIYNLSQGGGSSQAEIVARSRQLCSRFSESEYINAFRAGLRSGLFTNVVPVIIDYCCGTNGPVRYVFGPQMDRMSANSPYVKFLLSLVGGYNNPNFVQWFNVSTVPCAQYPASCVQCV